LLEKVTLSPGYISADDLVAPRGAGVSDRAILDATYVCVGFNIIARIADALGFKIPSEELFFRAARLLRIFGYRRLSGFWIISDNKRRTYSRNTFSTNWTLSESASFQTRLSDPYAKKMDRLRHGVLSGPGALSPHLRRAISEGAYASGPLGTYVQKVAQHAYMLNDDDIAELHRAHYTDDQIFEATVSAALGAGLFRLDCVLNALCSSRPAGFSYSDWSNEEPIVENGDQLNDDVLTQTQVLKPQTRTPLIRY
jgi:hypothetical protein